MTTFFRPMEFQTAVGSSYKTAYNSIKLDCNIYFHTI